MLHGENERLAYGRRIASSSPRCASSANVSILVTPGSLRELTYETSVVFASVAKRVKHNPVSVSELQGHTFRDTAIRLG